MGISGTKDWHLLSDAELWRKVCMDVGPQRGCSSSHLSPSCQGTMTCEDTLVYFWEGWGTLMSSETPVPRGDSEELITYILVSSLGKALTPSPVTWSRLYILHPPILLSLGGALSFSHQDHGHCFLPPFPWAGAGVDRAELLALTSPLPCSPTSAALKPHRERFWIRSLQ